MPDDAHDKFVVDIWSDYVCPFCYFELPVLHHLKEEFGTRVHVVWHTFELRPEPVPTLDPQGNYLRETWEDAVYPLARQRGMHVQLPPVQPRSRKAFEAAIHAREMDYFEGMHAALFHAFFVEGKDIEDTETLLEIASTVGLEMDPLKDALDAGRYTHRVLDEERQAHHLGITGVPLMLVRRAGQSMHNAVHVRGAVPYEELKAAVMTVAHSERAK